MHRRQCAYTIRCDPDADGRWSLTSRFCMILSPTWRGRGEFLGQVKRLRGRVGNFQASFTVLLQPLEELLTEHVSFMEVFHLERTETDALPRLLGDAFQNGCRSWVKVVGLIRYLAEEFRVTLHELFNDVAARRSDDGAAREGIGGSGDGEAFPVEGALAYLEVEILQEHACIFDLRLSNDELHKLKIAEPVVVKEVGVEGTAGHADSVPNEHSTVLF